MKEVKVTLKNMVSKSCIRLVELYFASLEGVHVKLVSLGEVTLLLDDNYDEKLSLQKHFANIGFEVVDDPLVILTEKVKIAAIELIIFANNNNSIIRNSDYISDRLQMPYDRLSKVFSKVTGTTLEKYIILLKIEKIKEMVLEGKLTLSEISYQMGYSSVQYLSRQFKQITGYTFSEFKNLDNPERVLLEDILTK